jgi:hypothetical protein
MEVNHPDAFEHILSHYETLLGIKKPEETGPVAEKRSAFEARLFKKRNGQFLSIKSFSSLSLARIDTS